MYEFHIELQGDFEVVLDHLREALQAEGLGIVSQVDVQQIVTDKLGQEIGPYLILGACAPGLALRVIEADPNAGTLLPYNVVVREPEAGRIVVNFMDPQETFAMAGNEAVAEVGREAHQIIERVADRLAAI